MRFNLPPLSRTLSRNPIASIVIAARRTRLIWARFKEARLSFRYNPRMGWNKKNRNRVPTTPHKPFRIPIDRVIGVLGLTVAILIFWPRPTIEYAEPVDPENVMSATFTVVNSTFMAPLEHVSVGMGVCDISFAPEFVPSPTCNTATVGVVPWPEWSDHYLSSDEKFGISFGRIFGIQHGSTFSGADVQVVITYQWWFVPHEFEKHFRFVTKKQSDGKLHWYSQPIE